MSVIVIVIYAMSMQLLNYLNWGCHCDRRVTVAMYSYVSHSLYVLRGTERKAGTTTMTLVERSMSRSYLFVLLQLSLFVSLVAAYYLHPSHLLKRKLGQSKAVGLLTKPNNQY